MKDNKILIQTLKFTLFSASAGIIEFVSEFLLKELVNLPYWIAYLIALILSVLWNFTFNRRFTFKSAANVPIAMLKTFAFYVVFTPLSTYLGYLAEKRVNHLIVLIVTMLCNFVLEFLYDKFVVYRGNEDTL